ncbi:MAG: 4Fe-4S binding protein [Phycisphaerae bacterium]
MPDSLTERLHAAAGQAGADIVGIAPIERFEDVAAEHHPLSIFPECRSVIVLGKRIVRGCLRGVEEGTQMLLYHAFAVNWLPDRFMALTTVRVASWLEDQRWEAVPLPDLPVEVPPMGVPAKEGNPAPNVMVDFIDAAVRAGLGEIGLTGELMTPQFGHRQRVQLILTDAELEPTPMLDGSVCDRCGACAEACPLNAIDMDRSEATDICGKQMQVAKVDIDLCRRCQNGAQPNNRHASGRPDRLAASCMRACAQHMHEAGLLENRFHESFRKRPAWMIDASGVPRLEE